LKSFCGLPIEYITVSPVEYTRVNNRRNYYVANHKSAEKRNRQSQDRRLRNRVNKSQMKNAIRKVNDAVVAGSQEEAKEALLKAIPVIAKTASKGTIHKKTASRKISRLAKSVNKIESAA
jgi:small subunit ribosomal protein S20